MTDVHRTPEADRLAEARQSGPGLISGLPGMAYQCRNDPEWTMMMASPGCRDLTGFAPEDLVGGGGLVFGDLIHPDDEERVWAQVQNAVGEGRPFSVEYRIIGRDGTEKWVRDVGDGVFSEEGELLALEGYIFDVSRIHELEAMLLRAQRIEALGELAGGVAHDFNNLLTAILGSTQLLRDTLSGDSEAARELAQIEATAMRGAELAKQLLTFSRETGLKTEELELNEVIGDMERMLRRLIPESVRFETRYRAPSPRIRGDRSLLGQVVLNLVVNARDAVEGQGEVEIATEVETLDEPELLVFQEAVPGHYGVIRVRDTGPGIPPETRDRVFQPFFTTKESGTGLGLATVFGIVRQHEGLIRLDSDPGTGTTFDVLLPAANGKEREH